MAEAAVQIPRALLEQVYRHAREGYPEEVCGLLLGPRGGAEVDEARRCRNVQNELHAQDPTTFPRTAAAAYNLGHADLMALDRSLRSDRPARVIYHSHVDVGAYFSEEDHRAACAFGDEPTFPVQYLVIDAGAARVGGARLFAWEPTRARFVEVAAYDGE